MINFKILLLPSNPAVHEMLIARYIGVSCRIAFTLVGGNGNSITDNRAERVSFPPGDVTYQRIKREKPVKI